MTSANTSGAGRVPWVVLDGIPEGAVAGPFPETVTLGAPASVVADSRLDHAVLVMGTMTTERLGPVVAMPYRGYVEYRADDPTVSGRVVEALSAGDLTLSLTTPTAFALVDTAKVFCDALVARGALAGPPRAAVELALHETVANGILHGNLGLLEGPTVDARLYEDFCSRLQTRLESPEARRRWLTITARWSDSNLTLTVDDEGAGYEAGDRPRRVADGAASGRGLTIMRDLATAVTVAKGGRSTCLSFKL